MWSSSARLPPPSHPHYTLLKVASLLLLVDVLECAPIGMLLLAFTILVKIVKVTVHALAQCAIHNRIAHTHVTKYMYSLDNNTAS